LKEEFSKRFVLDEEPIPEPIKPEKVEGAKPGGAVEGEKLKTEADEYFYVKIGDKKVEVIKNPTHKDYQALSKEVKKDFPDMPKGEPKTRITYDAEGNKYAWRADKGTHPEVEPLINRKYNTTTNQNEYLLPEKPVAPGKPSVAKISEDEIGREIDRLLYAPIEPKGKTRYNFKTKAEIRDFTESFKKGVSGKNKSILHGVTQKYQDAVDYGWEQGRRFAKDYPDLKPKEPTGTTLYSGIPIHKAGEAYTKLVGEPLWDNLIMTKIPELLEKVPGGKLSIVH
jgi:hypothetical protein